MAAIDPMTQSRILVVEDDMAVGGMVLEMLKPIGGTVELVTNGSQAILRIVQATWDLLITDIGLPGADGFDVLAAARKLYPPERLPVILMTGGGDAAARLKGLQLGANEFLQKPLERSELIARVRTLLSMRWAHAELHQQMQQSERLAQLNELLVQTLAHDVRTPLATAKGFLEIGLDQLPATGGTARDHLIETLFSIVGAIDMTEDVDDISRMEAGEFTPRLESVNVEEAAAGLIKTYDDITESRHITMTVRSEGTEVEALADKKLLSRILRNLFTFALAHTPNHGKVDVHIGPGGATGLLATTFQYEAEHIPALAQVKLFDNLTQVELRRLGHLKNAGLGLTFCRLALGVMGGTISITSDQVEGTRFTFTLPRKASRTAALPVRTPGA